MSFYKELESAAFGFDIENALTVKKLSTKNIDRDFLRSYGKKLYAIAYFFPKNLSRVYLVSDNPQAKLAILNNILEEEGVEISEGGGANFDKNNKHLIWIENFLLSLGVSREICLKTALKYRGTFKDLYLEELLQKKEWLLAYAYLIGGEANLPRTFSHFVDSLRDEGFSEEELKFFYKHIELDIRHGDEGMKLLAQLTKPEKRSEVLLAITKGANSWFDVHNS